MRLPSDRNWVGCKEAKLGEMRYGNRGRDGGGTRWRERVKVGGTIVKSRGRGKR